MQSTNVLREYANARQRKMIAEEMQELFPSAEHQQMLCQAQSEFEKASQAAYPTP